MKVLAEEAKFARRRSGGLWKMLMHPCDKEDALSGRSDAISDAKSLGGNVTELEAAT